MIRDFVRIEFSLFLKHQFQNTKKVTKPSILGVKKPYPILDMTQTVQKILDGGPTAFWKHQIFIF